MRQKLLLIFAQALRKGVVCLFCLGAISSWGSTLHPASITSEWAEFISLSNQKNWRGPGHPLRVSPTKNEGNIYIPYDISDAWRELDKMLPATYIDNIAKRFGEDCLSSEINDEAYQTHYYLLIFLEEKWLDQSESPLLFFLQQYFHLSMEQALSENNKEILIGMILCGYYEKTRLGFLPSLPKLTKKFGSALEDH
jgi:hypothetical protein